MKLYGEISKTEQQDDGTIKVWGYASSTAVDSDGETVTAEAMKAALPDYMKFGAVREMHDSKKAAGTAIEADVQEDGRTYFGALIVDAEAVKKVTAGVYKGFSIGGKVTDRDETNKSIIKGLKLVEVSLVDRPANPEAVLTVFKSDAHEDEVHVEANVESRDGGEDISCASTVIDLTKYTGERVWDAGIALQALGEILYLFTKEKAENGEAPDQLAALSAVIEGLKTFIASEIKEPDSAAGEEVVAYAVGRGDLEKAGREFSSKNAEKIQTIHDHAVSMGAACSSGKAADADDLHKMEDLQKRVDAITEERDALRESHDAIADELQKLKDEPAEPRARLNAVAVSKSEDSEMGPEPAVIRDSTGKINEAASLIKAAHRAGSVIGN
ncbi:MAG: HK97 family phage prohead protease [Chlorobiaceae bacterium]